MADLGRYTFRSGICVYPGQCGTVSARTAQAQGVGATFGWRGRASRERAAGEWAIGGRMSILTQIENAVAAAREQGIEPNWVQMNGRVWIALVRELGIATGWHDAGAGYTALTQVLGMEIEIADWHLIDDVMVIYRPAQEVPKPMTVADLVAKLLEMPQDMPVYRDDSECDDEGVSDIMIQSEVVYDYAWGRDYWGTYGLHRINESERLIEAVVIA